MTGRKMTRKQAWEACRELILSRRETYLCGAVSTLYLKHQISLELRNSMYATIEEQLRGHLSYSGWVKWRHPSTYLQMLDVTGSFQQGRLLWLDNLIANSK